MLKSNKNCKCCKEDKPISDFHKNRKTEDGKHYYCKSCVSEKNKNSYYKNQEGRKERAQVYRDSNSGRIKKYLSGYQKVNKHKYAAYKAYRNKRMSHATPDWLSEDQKSEMEHTYKLSRDLTEGSGIRHEVDHIVPIRSYFVCGLHVPWNLQILPQYENLRKSNREWPDMW